MKKASNSYRKKYHKDFVYDLYNTITVKIEDLPMGSDTKVEVLCDMCKKNKMTVAYGTYNRVVRNTGSYVCKECSHEKKYQTNLEKYGFPIASQSKAVQEKMKQTNLEKYGVDNYGKTKECHDKIKQTCLDKYKVEHFAKSQEIKDKKAKTNLDRYGVESVLQVKEFRDKITSTNLERYGVEHPSSLLEMQEKIRQTNLERYGVPYNLQSPEVREKITKTLYKNGTAPTSKQQRYIFNLYKSASSETELNYPIVYYSADICLPIEKIDIEYDGGFHGGQVQTGKLTKEEFNRKELIRDKVIKSEGYKIIRIKSDSDRLPQDSTLLQMLSEAKQYFSETEHSWVIYDIDNSRMINAENNDANGISYDFGILRRIKDKDLDNQNNQNDLTNQTNKKGA